MTVLCSASENGESVCVSKWGKRERGVSFLNRTVKKWGGNR